MTQWYAGWSLVKTEGLSLGSEFVRSFQVVIDRIRGKERYSHPDEKFSVRPDAARRRAALTGEIERMFYAHQGRTIHKWQHYFEIYEKHFEPFRASGKPVRLLEIGVRWGGSLDLWRKYFGPSARIVGIDIDPECAQRHDPENTVIIGDQTDPKVLDAAIEKLGGGVDIVIDDGSHLGRHQIPSFEYLYPRISERGIYLCEDLHVSYWPNNEGGLGKPGTFIEHVKPLIDRLQSWHLDSEAKKQSQAFAETTYGIYVYLDVIVIEKRPISTPYHVQIGK